MLHELRNDHYSDDNELYNSSEGSDGEDGELCQNDAIARNDQNDSPLKTILKLSVTMKKTADRKDRRLIIFSQPVAAHEATAPDTEKRG